VGDILINEVLPAPKNTYATEWIELYNATTYTLDISNMWIDDLIGGGGSPKQIPADTFLAPGGFYVMDVNNYFNNAGDDANLLGTDGSTLYDSFSYSQTSYDLSFCRETDGSSTWLADCVATYGASNN
jgi:hypothetical protein